jgi:hypothetical protein
LDLAREHFDIDTRRAKELPHGGVHHMRLKGSRA